MGDGLDEMLSAARARVGQEIGGKYRLEALVGVGGTAAVYAATHRNGHRVAVKVSHKKVYASPALWARFLRESYLGNVLEHDGVVRVLDDDVTQDGAAYLVMELLQGASLRAIAAELPLDVAYVAAVGDVVLDVLSVAHQKGIVHRDVKPENIFLTDEGTLKLLDFGVARQLGNYGPAVTTTGAILGTPAFMAPEQVLGRGPLLGPPTDLWSVGATLFTLIAGQHVHEGSTTGEVFVSAATRPARSLASVAPGCPAAICAVVDRALKREIEDRWADASEMRAALAEAFRAAFGKPLDAKTLLARMARELLPLVVGGGEARPGDGGEPIETQTAGPTWSGHALPPRAPGPRASGYRDLPPTLRDAPSSSGPTPRPLPFAGEIDVAVAPTERAPETPPGPHPRRRAIADAGRLLFQDSTLVSQGGTSKPKSRAKTVLAAVGLVAASSALGFGMSRARSTLSMQALTPPPAAASALLSPAKGGGGEADLAYGEAFQLWYDGAPSRARERFLDVARLDAARPEGYLYAVVVSEWVTMADRELFAKARSLRARLPAREAALLEALEPMMAEPASTDEADQRLEAWARAYPNDLASKLVLGQYYMRAHHGDQQLALAPQVGGAIGHWFSALAYLQRDDVEGGVRGLERCVATSPGATDCLEWLARVETNEGRCVAAEKTARKLVAAAPDDPDGYRYLARAVMGQTHSAEATRAILRNRWARLPAESRAEVEAADEFFLHAYEGEFDLARQDNARWREAVARSPDAWRRGYALEHKLGLERELGDAKAAADTARSMEFDSRAWLSHDAYATQAVVSRALYLTGQIDHDELLRRRGQAAEALREKGSYFGTPGIRWYETHVRGVKDARDAADALLDEPAQKPLVDPALRGVHIDAEIGRLHLLGGRREEALRELRRAADGCWYAESPLHVQAHLWLGEALEQANDVEGACRAYAYVSARWGRDARSVTARAARERSKAARCPASGASGP